MMVIRLDTRALGLADRYVLGDLRAAALGGLDD